VLVQVGLERVELAGARPLPAAVGEFLPGGGAVVTLDGVQAPAQVAGDLPEAAPLGPQPVDQRVVLPDALGVLPGRLRQPGIRRLLRRGLVLRRRRAWLCQAGPVGRDAPLGGLGEVLPQVEPVGDLDRLRCPGAGAVGVGAGAVTADDLDAGMSRQPVRERLGGAALQQVERRAGLAVDQERAVALAAPEREVVDSEHPRLGRFRVRRGHDQAQQDLPARRDAQGAGEPGGRPAGQRDRDVPQHAGQEG
jgi:hypothetical protein